MQAIRTHNHGVTADEYSAILGHAQHYARANRPDVHVIAVQRIGGRWWATTNKGPITFDDLCRSDTVLTGSHDYDA